jgi:hypothetical protein
MSSPSFDSLAETQHGQVSGAGMTTCSRGRCSGNGFRVGRLRSKDLTAGRFACSAASSSSLASASAFALELQSIELPRRALGASSVNRPPQLFDLKIKMRARPCASSATGRDGARLAVPALSAHRFQSSRLYCGIYFVESISIQFGGLVRQRSREISNGFRPRCDVRSAIVRDVPARIPVAGT